jgi:adenylate cyclase
LQRWLALDEACEDAHRALAELYAARGRRALALAQIERCKEALAQTYAAAPDERTVALARTLAEAPLSPVSRLSKPPIAVLPFEDRSGADEAWLSDGIAEDVIVALSKFDRLLVIARQSSFRFRESQADLREIGRALGARYVLTGSVRREAGRLRVTVQLADADSGLTLWAQRYESTAADMFAVEDEITRVIVATLAGRVEADQLARVARKPSASLEAYDWLLKAKMHHHRYTLEDNALAQECLERACGLDPNFALAYAWSACVLVQRHHLQTDFGLFARAREFLQRACALEEGESECHRILASASLNGRRFEEAEHHQRRALELNPNDDRILSQMGELLTYLGRAAEALPWIELAIRLNPYRSDTTCYDHARALYQLGRAAEAQAALRPIRTLRLPHLVYHAAIAARLGDAAQAAQRLAEIRRVDPAFAVEAFVGSLPYEDRASAQRLIADLSRVS